MMKVGKIAFLIVICGFFSLAIVHVFFSSKSTGTNSIPIIANMLPSDLPGWEIEDLPVGETEEVKRKMGEILNYDDAVFREYSRGITKVQVYISYWAPGKSHFRLVYGHTPDICWVNGGWKPVVQDPSFYFILDGENPIQLKEAQYREFEIGHENIRVMFWQLLDGEPFTYGNFGYPPATAIFTDIFQRGFNQKPEQWFIRISANREFSSLKRDKGFQDLIRSLANFELEKVDH